MINELQMPTLILSTFKKVKSKLESDHAFGHIDWCDRIELWQAMNKVHGFGPSDCRRAVLCARTVWPLLAVWEQAVVEFPEIIRLQGSEQYPHKLLLESTQTFLDIIQKMDIDTEEILRRKLEDMWNYDFYPVIAILPAILYASNYLLHSSIENVESEYERDVWELVLTEQCSEYDEDDKGECDWEDYECHFWASEVVGGDLRKSINNVQKRKQFWNQWLDDFVEVNVLSIDDLKLSLYPYLEEMP